MVEWLLEHGAAARDEDGSGNTPLHCAALGGDTGQLVVYNQQYTHTLLSCPIPIMISLAAVAMRLVEAGAELEAANHELDRPLHLAASVGNLEVYI